MIERVRGSIDVTATLAGLVPVAKTAHALEAANPGKGLLVIASGMKRAKQTAEVLLRGKRTFAAKDGGLADPRAYGELEGRELTPQVVAVLHHLASQPDLTPPKGRHPLSTRDGESAQAFVSRAARLLRHAAAVARAHPQVIPVIVTFNSMIKAIQWTVESGSMKKLSDYLGQGGYGPGAGLPGSVHLVEPTKGGLKFRADWNLKKPVPPGAVVLLRHAATSYNAAPPRLVRSTS